jgi:hypothetical protein
MGSSSAAASNLRRLRRAMGFPRPMPLATKQPTMPIVGFVSARSANTAVREVAAFHKGFNETGYVEGQNATIEYQRRLGQSVQLGPSIRFYQRALGMSWKSAKNFCDGGFRNS